MKIVRKTVFILVALVVICFVALCVWFYTAQEKALFRTVKHPSHYQYQFAHRFEERNIRMADNTVLNGVLFKADTSKGLILWLPGGRGMLDSIGE